VGEFLQALAAARPDPGGGSAAALAAALAASLCEMSAALSARHLGQAGQMAEEARALAARAGPLAEADAESYRQVIAAQREGGQRLAEALAAASAVPLDVTRIGARVAGLAARVAAGGNPRLRGDAFTAALLAAAAARAAAALVRINSAGAGPGAAAGAADEAERLAGVAGAAAASAARLA
jgi:formiminotetrahydrofolate cyclodeaminase